MTLLNDVPCLEKIKLLKENGWVQLWHPDNWVRISETIDPHFNIDMAGRRTETAYEICCRELNNQTPHPKR